MVEEVELVHPILRENTSSMKPCLLEASLEEEFLNSVLDCSKQVVGMSLIIALLNPTTMVKVKAAHSSTTFAAAPLLNSMNTAPEVLEDALPMVEEVENAAVTPLWTDADSSILMKIMTVITTMDKTMQDYLTSKHMEEELAASASLVT